MGTIDSMTSNSNQLTLRFLEQMLKLYGDTVNALSKNKNNRFMDETEIAMNAILDHQAKGGKALVHEMDKEGTDIIQNIAKRYHVPVAVLSYTESATGKQKYAVTYRDRDKQVMNRILMEYRRILAPGIGEMSKMDFMRTYLGRGIGQYIGLTYAETEAFRMEAGFRNLTYTIVVDRDAGFEVLFPEEMSETARDVLNDSLSDAKGKEEMLAAFQKEKERITSLTRESENRPLVITDAKQPNHFIVVQGEEFREYFLSVSKNGIRENGKNGRGGADLFATVSCLDEPLIMDAGEFPFLNLKNGKYVPLQDRESFFPVLKNCKAEYEDRKDIITCLHPWKEEEIYSITCPKELESELYDRIKGHKDIVMKDGHIAFRESAGKDMEKICDETIYKGLGTKERICLRMKLEGRISPSLGKMDFDDTGEPFLITNAGQASVRDTALLFEKDSVTIFWQGEKQGTYSKSDPEYERVYELIYVLSDPVAMTAKESMEKDADILMHDLSPSYRLHNHPDAAVQELLDRREYTKDASSIEKKNFVLRETNKDELVKEEIRKTAGRIHGNDMER